MGRKLNIMQRDGMRLGGMETQHSIVHVYRSDWGGNTHLERRRVGRGMQAIVAYSTAYTC